MKRIVAVSGQISEDLIYRKILTTFFLKTMIVWSRRRMRFRNGARRCRSRLDFHCEHTTATSSPIPTSTTVKINRSLHHLPWASPGIFPEGGKLLGETQNSQGSPLGCVLRFSVSKKSKGPPLVKIFWQNFGQKLSHFLDRERSEPENFGILF